MTLKQCAEAMRQAGIPTCERTICDGIEAGIYPFGRIRSMGRTGRRTVEILEPEFREWLKNPRLGKQEPEKPDLITRYFADPVNAAHFSKWCAEHLGGE